MRVLLDENLPHRLRHVLRGAEIVTAWYAGWAGAKNGELLKLAEDAGFDLLITGDRNLAYQQNMGERRIAIVELSAQDWPALSGHLRVIQEAVDRAQPGSYEVVNCGQFRR